jgi:hypothetical protein
MGFPIDLAYLAADGTVVKTCSRLQPFRFSTGGWLAHSVLELPAGFLDHMQVVVGEKLGVTPVAGEAADAASGVPAALSSCPRAIVARPSIITVIVRAFTP